MSIFYKEGVKGMTIQAKAILIYQEYEPLNILMERILWSKGFYNVYIIKDITQFNTIYRAVKPDVILFEVDSSSNYEKLEKLLKETNSGEVQRTLIGISGYGNEAIEQKVKGLGIENFIKKPFNINYFLEQVEEKLKSRLYEKSHL
jgi:DNA-binding NtrC family response regulator